MTLYVCATPIGNLGDVSLRLLEVLKAVDAVLAEDTRRTLRLLNHYGLKKKLISLHEHNEKHRISLVLDGLSRGGSFALLSDAGTPGISDPGAVLVRAVRDAGFRIVVVPGPSAVTAALSGSGFKADRFLFGGYPPRRSAERRAFYGEWVRPGWPSVFFEAPHRLERSLEDLAAVWPDAQVVLYREISKMHESSLCGKPGDVLRAVSDLGPRGEYVLIVRLNQPADASGEGPIEN